MKHSIAILIFALTSISAIAQKYSNEFLNIGVGARAHGLGLAASTTTADATAPFWNPAGLMNTGVQEGVLLGAMHNEWFAGIGKFDYLGVAIPVSNGKRMLGFSGVRFGVDDIPNTLSLYSEDGTINYDNVVSFSATDWAFVGTYAQYLGKNNRLQLGGNVKIIHRVVGSFASSWGFGIDAGLLYNANPWKLGIFFKDATTTFNAWSFSLRESEKQILQLTNNTIPINSVEKTKPQIILGAAFQKNAKNFNYTAAIDFVVTTDGSRNVLISSNPFSIAPNIGGELGFRNMVFARVGASRFQQQTDFGGNKSWIFQPSVGIGLNFNPFRIDYAFSDISGDASLKRPSHIISLQFHIKPKRASRFG